LKSGFYITRIDQNKIVVESKTDRREIRLGSPYQTIGPLEGMITGALMSIDGDVIETNTEALYRQARPEKAAPIIAEGALRANDGQITEYHRQANPRLSRQPSPVIPQGALMLQSGTIKENPSDSD